MNAPTYVIGGGPSGLAVAAALRQRGVHAHVLERSHAVGTSWSRHYDRLRLRTLRAQSGLPGLHMPSRYGPYVRRADVADYLRGYADHHALSVMLGVRIERIERVAHPGPETGRWQLHAADGRRFAARSVVVAAGRNSTPVLPPWPGRQAYRGTLLHSSDYRNAAPFAGQDVLVVGAGNAGLEIALDLSEGGARHVRLSLRTAPLLVPQRLGPCPFAHVAVVLNRLPARVADPLLVLLSRLSVPDLATYGLPRATARPVARARRLPIQDVGLLSAVQNRRVRPVAAVAALSADAVHLADGSVLRPDVVIAATGYAPELGQLVRGLDVLDADGLPVASARCGRDTGLHFVGFSTPLGGVLRKIGSEARRVARAESRPRRRRVRAVRGPAGRR